MASKKSNIFETHTKLKIEVMATYASSYLSVMLQTRKFKNIKIIDLFAGAGKDETGYPGTALRIIQGVEKAMSDAPALRNDERVVCIHLNEKNKKKYESLLEDTNREEQIINNNVLRITHTKMYAQQYIDQHLSNPPDPDEHLFLNIDPYGYTQIDNIAELFQRKQTDFIMFFPLSHIYRFFRKEETKQDQLGGILKFLNSIGVNEETFLDNGISDEILLAKFIRDNIERNSNKEYVIMEIIENQKKRARAKYIMVYACDNEKGADIFLKEFEKSKNKFDLQLDLNLETLGKDDIEKEAIIMEILKNGKLSNKQLYTKLLKRGIDASSKLMVEMYKAGKINIEYVDKDKKNFNTAYVNYDNFKKDKPMAYISEGDGESRNGGGQGDLEL